METVRNGEGKHPPSHPQGGDLKRDFPPPFPLGAWGVFQHPDENPGARSAIKEQGNIMKIDQNHIEKIVQTAKSYNARRLILFGSSSNEANDARDVDLACDGINGWKLYEFGAEIEECLNMPVEVVSLTPPNRLTRYIESKGKVLI